jgi:hypothetical protein
MLESVRLKTVERSSRAVPAPYPDQQRNARRALREIFSAPGSARLIHYSCESFDNRVDGRSPRITSIAIRRLASSDTESFSIHRVAERRHIPLDQIEPYYNELERQMLDEYYAYFKSAGEVTYLHWNMRDANYGFAAIDHRYAVLGGAPVTIPETRRLDLSPLFQQIYGSRYIDNPKLATLARKNLRVFGRSSGRPRGNRASGVMEPGARYRVAPRVTARRRAMGRNASCARSGAQTRRRTA